MPIQRSTQTFPAVRIQAIARELLEASALCAIATVGPAHLAHVNTAYFAWSPGFDLVWLSDPDARHSKNLATQADAAVAVYDSGQVWGGPDRGIQLLVRRRRPPAGPLSACTSCTLGASRPTGLRT
ncbi:pyridoxamine 5'-phosphate oxidase family protein [Arthrobacter sp. E918]|uniref:Pyridoxamine 5'-phosphate oxidase family protein n=1 Tax=Arthrobacter mobilis TaxID=2724944 RepID=A0A7X6K7Y2_9MICC|nr:pyridoxamine 5'-phosphate oxidase family protein [Arthrobacter mobilis]